jgi:hypothetical protein
VRWLPSSCTEPGELRQTSSSELAESIQLRESLSRGIDLCIEVHGHAAILYRGSV